MLNRMRMALYCLLLIALPLQVFASGGAQHCVSMQMPISHSTDALANVGNDAAGIAQQVTQTRISAMSGGCIGSRQDTRAADQSTDHCAISVGCGIAAISVSASPLVKQVLLDDIAAITPPGPSVGFMTGAPERPPRTTT